jgi:hypothetical protein
MHAVDQRQTPPSVDVSQERGLRHFDRCRKDHKSVMMTMSLRSRAKPKAKPVGQKNGEVLKVVGSIGVRKAAGTSNSTVMTTTNSQSAIGNSLHMLSTFRCKFSSPHRSGEIGTRDVFHVSYMSHKR